MSNGIVAHYVQHRARVVVFLASCTLPDDRGDAAGLKLPKGHMARVPSSEVERLRAARLPIADITPSFLTGQVAATFEEWNTMPRAMFGHLVGAVDGARVDFVRTQWANRDAWDFMRAGIKSVEQFNTYGTFRKARQALRDASGTDTRRMPAGGDDAGT